MAGQLFLDGCSHGFRNIIDVRLLSIAFLVGDYPVDMRSVLFELIEREVVMHQQEDDEGDADADGETEYIDDGKCFVSPKAAESDQEVVLKHRC